MALLQLLSLVVSFSLIAVQPWSVVNALVVDPGDASTSQLLTASEFANYKVNLTQNTLHL